MLQVVISATAIIMIFGFKNAPDVSLSELIAINNEHQAHMVYECNKKFWYSSKVFLKMSSYFKSASIVEKPFKTVV